MGIDISLFILEEKKVIFFITRLQTPLPVPPPNGGGDPGLRKRLLQSGRQCDNEGTRKGYKVPRMWLKEVRAYVQPLENSEVHVVKGGERKIF